MADEVINKALVRQNFGRAVPTYDEVTVVQAQMAQSVIDALDHCSSVPTSVLELGCGTGRLTELLRRRLPHADIVAIDLSSEMIEAAQQRLSTTHVEFIAGDGEVRTWGERSFDLIVSSATMQWFEDPASALQIQTESLNPGGGIVHSTLGPRTFQELFEVYRSIETSAGLTPLRRGLALHDSDVWRKFATESGLEDVETIVREVVCTYSSCREFLRTVHDAGASYTTDTPGRAGLLSQVMRRYDETYMRPGGVGATYEIVEIKGRR